MATALSTSAAVDNRPEDSTQEDAAKKWQPVRISLDVTPQLNARIEEIARTYGKSKSDVLRNAVGLFALAVEVKEENKKLVIEDGDRHREIVGYI